MKSMIPTTIKSLALLAFSTFVLADSIQDEGQRFYKCYALFTGERVAMDHPIMAKVRSGSMNGTDACMELLAKATIKDDGTIGNEDEAKKILGRINELHNKWFFIKDPLSVNGIFVYSWPNPDLHDKHDPAFHLTYSLLKPGQKYKDIVTRNFNLEAIRNSPNQPVAKGPVPNQDYCTFENRSPAFFNKHPTGSSFGMIGAWYGDWELALFQGSSPVSYPHELYDAACRSDWGTKAWQPRIIRRGEFVGLKPFSYQNPVIDLSAMPFYAADKGSAKFTNFSAYHGAGALGTQAYMIGNLGYYFTQDGGTQVRRRFSKNMLSDFLCRELPALYPNDVAAEVYPDSEISFRRGGSCMSCHMSMDPMAGTSRRIMGAGSNGSNTFYGNYATFMKDAGAGTYPRKDYPTMTPDQDFSQRDPVGRIMFRGYDDRLYDEEVMGLTALGDKFAEYDDFYVCGAKKYFKLLTGIDVRIPGPGAAPLNTAEQAHLKQMVTWGLELKKTQNVQALLRSIIASPNFIRVEGK